MEALGYDIFTSICQEQGLSLFTWFVCKINPPSGAPFKEDSLEYKLS